MCRTTWRRSRPFWSGLLTTTGGAAILLLPADLYTVLSLPGTAGLAGFLLGGIITTSGLLLWYQPRHHTLLSIIILLAALASFLYTNFGGFMIGMLLALTGGSLAFAWAPATEHATELAQVAARAASDKLATDIVLIDVSERLAITDVFVIASGNNERQVEAIVDEVEEKLRQSGVKPVRREGRRDGRWVLLDYADIVVHVQHVEERVFYALERLWKDCPFIPVEA